MKFGSYLFGLSLAVTASVTPADAQEVHFTRNLVSNTCHVTITVAVRSPLHHDLQDIVLQPTQRSLIENSSVPFLQEHGTFDYVYAPDTEQHVYANAPCYFDQCVTGEFISMTCRWEHNEYIRFDEVNLKKRSTDRPSPRRRQ
jgi:hypothetical protein